MKPEYEKFIQKSKYLRNLALKKIRDEKVIKKQEKRDGWLMPSQTTRTEEEKYWEEIRKKEMQEPWYLYIYSDYEYNYTYLGSREY